MNTLPYPSSSTVIQTEQRAAINQGILNLIRAGKNPDKAKVFAGFTGRGGLHGLKYEDFTSRYEYSEAKRLIEQGQFFTPSRIVKLIADYLNLSEKDTVADLTCGAGAFANHFGGSEFFGLEIDRDAVTVAQYLFPEAEIIESDLRSWTPNSRFRFITGNPPFALRWMVPQCPLANATGEAASEDVFLWKARLSMAAGGSACFVAPANWLEDDIIHTKALEFITANFERVSEVLLPSNAFAAYGVTNFDTKIVLLRGWMPGEEAKKTMPVVIDGRGLDAEAMLQAWRAGTTGYFEFRSQLGGQRANLEMADQREGRLAKTEAVTKQYRFLRLVSELERHNHEAAKHALSRWEWVIAPTQYDRDGNPVPKPTRDQVIKEVRRELRLIDVPQRALVRVVRTSKGIKVKTYSRAAALAVTDQKFDLSNNWIANQGETAALIEQRIRKVEAAVKTRNARRLDNDGDAELVEFDGLSIKKTVNRLHRRFQLWNRPLVADFEGRTELQARVRSFYVALADKGIIAYDQQISEIAAMVAKPGALIGWEMGCGKSLAAVAWDTIKQEQDRKAGRRIAKGKTLIISSALAIELHWTGQMVEYGYSHSQPANRLEWLNVDFGTDDKPSYLLATHHQVCRYAKLIRSLVRQGKIRSVLVDESDEFGNRASRRTQALLTAGREAVHKLLMTGTPVRNRASELYSQLCFLMHGETFFRCVAKYQVIYDAKVHDFKIITNDKWLESYHGHGGMALFKRCHSPGRPTVMGAERSIPELPGKEELEYFLACFRSRLRLRALLQRDPFTRDTNAVELSDSEREAYDELARDAVNIAKEHLGNIGDRRASMLSLAHAIRILQQAATMPNKFGFVGTGAKEQAIVDQIRASQSSHIAVGVIWREAVERLLPVLQREFPDRVIVSFDGEDSFAKRRRKLMELEKAERGIVLCTQQSVRSSLNLPIVSEVIAEALPWNFTGLNQWAMRFCRLTSKKVVTVRLMIATGTIEERILGLLLRKEAVAQPIAGDELEDEGELFAEYGITAADLDELAKYLAEYDPTIRNVRIAA